MAPSAVNTTSLSPAAGFSLQIIIVGAGIAGLAAATGLRRAGHRVTVGALHQNFAMGWNAELVGF